MTSSDKPSPARELTLTWFDHMTGYLSWKVLGPDITNPFATPHTLATLNRMAHQRDFLTQFISVRCTCDGYEVMLIHNPDNPRVVSNHPCVSAMNPQDVIDYLQRAKLDDFISEEIDNIERSIREHVSNRKQEMRDEEKRNDSIRINPKAAKGKQRDALGGGRSAGMRIIRRPG